MKKIDWYGCYNESWQGEITPEAFSHPAKYARGLIGRIYAHMLEQGYLKPGDKVGDPFGGVALGAIHAMLNGLDWYGVELEPKFVSLGGQNFELWRNKYGDLLRGTAVLMQGDSRQFAHVIDGVVSSPPFGEGETRNRSNHQGGEIASMMTRAYTQDKQGETPGNLAHLPAKTADLDSVISSPPYVDAVNGNGEGPGARHDYKTHSAENAEKKSSQNEYGHEPGNLGNMPGGDLDGVISSPPFENSQLSGLLGEMLPSEKRGPGGHGGGKVQYATQASHNNLGSENGDSFWQAAAIIVQQVYQSLEPGSYAAWVCGDFVRKGKRVYFGRQWLQLCESMGFTAVEWITAWKSEYKGTQLDIFGNAVEKRIDRVSFFRRLANEKNPENAILNEDVIIVRKPPSPTL